VPAAARSTCRVARYAKAALRCLPVLALRTPDDATPLIVPRRFAMKYLPEYGIYIDGAASKVLKPDSYEAIVEVQIKTIANLQTGRAVFQKIKKYGAAKVVPYDGSLGVCNASVGLTKQRLPVVMNGQPVAGDVYDVEYSPDTWHGTTHCRRNLALEPDAVLFHELVHAFRLQSGLFHQLPLPVHLAHYKDEEEFFAVTLENIYQSEAGRQTSFADGGFHRSNLRDGHTFPKKQLPGSQATSVTFLGDKDRLRLVEKFWNQQPETAALIARVPATFNPIQAYYVMTRK
jgi:hypothetical protein